MAIVLQVVCSAQVKKNASLFVGDFFAWSVDPQRPFNDESNLGKLCAVLNISGPCELCHFAEGIVGDPVDVSRSPEDLGYRPRMQVYVRLKQTTGEGKADAVGAAKLSLEEQKLLRRLKNYLMPNLGPDDPCPLCARMHQREPEAKPPTTFSPLKDRDPSMHTDMTEISMSESPRFVTIGASAPKFRPEVGVQCGQASRVDDVITMPIAFGSAARLQQYETETYFGSPRDFPGPARAPADGGPFLDFSRTVTDLKAEAEKFQRERDELALELREMTRQKVALERWKAEHRCEETVEGSQVRSQYEQLQYHLRDLMRGRGEVFAMLQQRRSAGVIADDGPIPRIPFITKIPSMDSPVDPHSLLSKDLNTLRSASAEDLRREADRSMEVESMQILKRPSGLQGSAQERAPDEPLALMEQQRPGECLLRVASTAGPAFHVKRKISSGMRNGQHIFTLASLDGVVTDEVFVDELQCVGVTGPHGLRLQTKQYDWQLYLDPSGRERWIHWLYALNPYLSATSNISPAGIPNSY